MNLITNDRPDLELVLRNNKVPAGASLLTNQRDPDRTTTRYQESDDLGVVKVLNDTGWFINQYQQVKPHAKFSDKAMFKPYLATYTNDSFPVLPGEGRATIVQKGSHDGTKKLILDIGFFRHICINGLLVGTKLFESIKLKHIGEIPAQLGELIEKVHTAVPQLYGSIQEMTKIILSADQVADFAAKAIALRYPDGKEGIKPQDILQVRRTEDSGTNLWKLLNVCQENLIKGGTFRFTTKSNVSRASREIKNIDLQYNINKNLWNLADSYLQ